MANIKSAKKRAKQSEKKRLINVARKSAIKTATKALLEAIDNKKDVVTVQELLRSVEAKLARAKNKGVFHRNTSARKTGRLARRVAVYASSQPA